MNTSIIPFAITKFQSCNVDYNILIHLGRLSALLMDQKSKLYAMMFIFFNKFAIKCLFVRFEPGLL